MSPITKLSAADVQSVGFYVLTRIEHQRKFDKCGPQEFPSYDRTHTSLQAGRCEIVITGNGGTDVNAMSVLVYPPATIGIAKGICVSEHIRKLASHEGVESPTLGGKYSGELPNPRDIDKTRFEAYEKLVRSGQKVPRQLWAGIINHIEHGQTCGTALTYILEGDLFKAAVFADDQVRESLGYVAAYIQHHAPPGCFGSEKKVQDWKRDRMSDAKAKAAA